MKKLSILPLLLCLSLSMSCSTINKTKEKLDYLNQKIDKVKDYSEAKVKELEKKKTSFEGAIGHEITKENAKETVAEVIKDPSLWRLLRNPEFWQVIGLAGLGLFGTKKAADLGVKKLHAKGREMVGPSK